LRTIALAVDSFWKQEKTLPKDLDELSTWEGLSTARSDPETGVVYTYRPADKATYELCATFARGTSEDPSPYAGGVRFDRWRHPAGEKCFDLATKYSVRVG
jgi:hypothetical protein